MKFRLILYSLAAVTLLADSVQAEVHIGAMLGSLNSNLSGQPPFDVKIESRNTFGAGAIIDIGLTSDVRLSLQPYYSPRGASLTVSIPDSDERKDTSAIEVDYLALPVMARIIADNGIAYVVAGFEFAFLLSAEWKVVNEPPVDVKDEFQQVDLAANLGVGVLPRLGRLRGMIELRYSQSLRNAFKPESSDAFVPRLKYSGFQLWLGVLLPLGGGEG